jgi:hypothetical protein
MAAEIAQTQRTVIELPGEMEEGAGIEVEGV